MKVWFALLTFEAEQTFTVPVLWDWCPGLLPAGAAPSPGQGSRGCLRLLPHHLIISYFNTTEYWALYLPSHPLTFQGPEPSPEDTLTPQTAGLGRQGSVPREQRELGMLPQSVDMGWSSCKHLFAMEDFVQTPLNPTKTWSQGFLPWLKHFTPSTSPLLFWVLPPGNSEQPPPFPDPSTLTLFITLPHAFLRLRNPSLIIFSKKTLLYLWPPCCHYIAWF